MQALIRHCSPIKLKKIKNQPVNFLSYSFRMAIKEKLSKYNYKPHLPSILFLLYPHLCIKYFMNNIFQYNFD